jgi:hypothetical protein
MKEGIGIKIDHHALARYNRLISYCSRQKTKQNRYSKAADNTLSNC